VSTPDDMATTLGKILAELAEIKILAHTVATNSEDIELGKKAVAKIEARLAEIDVLVAGLPKWLARIAQLELKQESDDQDRQDDTTEVVDVQEKVNVTFRERIAELFDVTSLLQKASLKLFAILLIIGVAAVSIILKAAGFS
jgi:hypothetical protein